MCCRMYVSLAWLGSDRDCWQFGSDLVLDLDLDLDVGYPAARTHPLGQHTHTHPHTHPQSAGPDEASGKDHVHAVAL